MLTAGAPPAPDRRNRIQSTIAARAAAQALLIKGVIQQMRLRLIDV
eukprot:COSAG02_NODE_47062_length_344_cov_0.534694_1_plen_45_part_10